MSPRSQPSLTDDDDGAAGGAALAPAVEERLEHLAEPGAAATSRGSAAPRGGQRPVGVAQPHLAGHPGQPGADREHLGRGRPGAHRGVREAQERVGVGAHRPRDVDQQHHRRGRGAGAGAAGRARRRRAASRARCARASTAAVPRAAPAGRAHRRRGHQQREQPPQLLALGGGRARRRPGAAAPRRRWPARRGRAPRRPPPRRSRRPAARRGQPRCGGRLRGGGRGTSPAEVRGERGVVAVQVVRAAAQRQPAGPVDVGRVEDVEAPIAASIASPGRGGGHAGVPQRAGEPERPSGRRPLRRLRAARQPPKSAPRARACTRSVSSRYFSTAPSVRAAGRGSSSRAPSACSAVAQSIASATPGGLSRSSVRSFAVARATSRASCSVTSGSRRRRIATSRSNVGCSS